MTFVKKLDKRQEIKVVEQILGIFMRLPDFSNDIGLNDLRSQMGARYIEIELEDSEWQRLIIQLEQYGIDVPFSEVKIQPDRTFEYKGQRVIVYIRDQHTHIVERSGGYKFHLSHCRTLTDMCSKNRYSRYVVTNRKDGKFIVNLISKNSKSSKENLELELSVCRNCLNELSITVTPSKFSLTEFFDTYQSQIKQLPKYSDRTAPINNYPANWTEIAQRRKKEEGWKCQCCSESFIEQKDLLHVHHIDGLKYNNQQNNLKVLCAKCHGDQPGHEHMKATPNYKQLMRVSIMSSHLRVAEQLPTDTEEVKLSKS